MSDPFDYDRTVDGLTKWLDEARMLRFALEAPAASDGPHDLHRQLIQARRALDRVEALLGEIVRLRSAAREALIAARQDLRIAEDEAYNAREVGFDQYATGRERQAWAATRTIGEQRRFHQVELLETAIDGAYEEMRLLHRGVDAVRRDVDTCMRIVTFERSLER